MQPVSNSTRRGSAHLLIRNTPLQYRKAIVLSIILAAPPMDLEQLPAYQRNHCEPNRLDSGWYPPPCRQHFLREVLVDGIGQHLTPPAGRHTSAPDWRATRLQLDYPGASRRSAYCVMIFRG